MAEENSLITWKALWRLFFMILFAWIVFKAQTILIGLFLAIVIAAALDRPVTYLEQREIPRILGTLLIYIGLILLFGIIAYAIIPTVISELNILLGSLGNISTRVSNFVDTSEIVQELNILTNRLTSIFFGDGSLIDISSRFLGGIVFAISVFVLSFYLTVGRDGVERLLLTLLPTAYEAKALELYGRVRRKIGRWFGAQLMLSIVVGTTVFIGLWLLGVRYALILAIIAGIMELVPYVGPIFSGALAVLVGAVTSLKLALYILILFVIIQQLENNVLVPAVMSRATALDPTVVLVAILIGAQVFGVVGLILGVPLAVLAQEIIEDWSETRHRRQRLTV